MYNRRGTRNGTSCTMGKFFFLDFKGLGSSPVELDTRRRVKKEMPLGYTTDISKDNDVIFNGV